MTVVAVAGGTGVVGRATVEALRSTGHEARVLSRSTGVDLVTGAGLAEALVGVEAVVDTANKTTMGARPAIDFFAAATGNLLGASAAAGVRHAVVLSIVGIDRVPHDYYAGKVAQEAVVQASHLPWTILRAAQFHEFALQMLDRSRFGGVQFPPKGRVQPVAAAVVGERLAELALGEAQGRATDLAGPREESLEEMVRAVARDEGRRGWIPPMSLPTGMMRGLALGDVLPGEDADLRGPTFDEWLAAR
ncbi:SDR family oxidoreductase [Brevibacterium litoralis]|uniref:SDR family oxidoreductase n=1 Tax=Brevibacterium litoralis TaxID=3138935 RepID=UPI0032ED06C9